MRTLLKHPLEQARGELRHWVFRASHSRIPEIVEPAKKIRRRRPDILRTIQLWQRDVLARATSAESAPENFPEDEAAIAAQAEGLSFADAAARVAVVDEVRELLEHNIKAAVALPRMARAFSKPKG